MWTGGTRLLVGLFLLSSPSGRVVCSLGPNPSSYTPSADQRPTSDALQLAGRINDALKSICGSACPAVMLFRNTTAAMAMFVANGDRAKLVYAPRFFAAVDQNFGDAVVVGIVAHEMGHGLDDVMGASWIRPGWTPELRADAWAGCALARSNLAARELDAALAALAKYPSAAHPAWSLRLPAIRTGYAACGGDGSKLGRPAAR